MKYKFNQFNVEIDNPSIESNYDSLVIYPRAKLDYFKTSSDEEVSRVIHQALQEFEA